MKKFKQQVKEIKKDIAFGYKLLFTKRLKDDTLHPINYKDLECTFITKNLKVNRKSKILNVGSYSQFIIGLMCKYNITTLDVRMRKQFMKKETVITADIKDINFLENTFDVIISTSAIEHFGLGRYGDEIDLDADKKAFEQFKKVLKPGGYLIFTTTIKKGEPEVCFNAHRIYNINIIHNFCRSFKCIDEKFYSKSKNQFCEFEDITSKEKTWDVYMGCWVK